jgi:hypothetical protein
LNGHFHESKAFRTTTFFILDNSCGRDLPEGLKSLAQISFGDIE